MSTPFAWQGRIALMTGPLPALCLLLAIPLLLAYPITRAHHAHIRQGVEAGTPTTPATPEPKAHGGGDEPTSLTGSTTRSARQNGCAQDARPA